MLCSQAPLTTLRCRMLTILSNSWGQSQRQNGTPSAPGCLHSRASRDFLCPLQSQDPDDDMRLRGSSGTDEHQHYVDDGLQRKYEGLHQMRLALNRQDSHRKASPRALSVDLARPSS